MKRIKMLWKNRYLAGFFALIMIYQAISPSLDVAANEIHKVHLADTIGAYFETDITKEPQRNEEEAPEEPTEKIKKEATVYEEGSPYSEDKEIISQRSENSKTYQLEDGTYVSELYFEPIHKKEGDGYVEIDNTLESTHTLYNGETIYENKDGLYEFSVAGDTMQMRDEAGHEFTIINEEADVSVYDVKENVILYSEAYPNMDMEYRLRGNNVSANFIINGVTETDKIRFTIQKGDLSIREQVDALEFMDGEEVIFAYTKAMLYDGDHRMKQADLDYTEKGDTVEVTLTIDQTWINDAQ